MGKAYVQDEVSARIVTYAQVESEPARLLVEWIHWDSAFRAAGLRLGDIIVAVDGKALVPYRTPGAPPTSSLVGQYGEPATWASAGKKEGDLVRLTVRRRRPRQGWESVEIAAPLQSTRTWVNDADRWILGDGGPDRMANNGGYESWSGWYEKFVKQFSSISRDWDRRVLDSRGELARLAEHQPQLDRLAADYPGPFTAALLDDVEAARALLTGELAEVRDLSWRQADDVRRAAVAEAAKAAWAAWLAARPDAIVEPFPAPNPVKADITPLVGKVVLLPQIHNRNWIPEGGHNFLAAGDDYQGWYFVDAETEPVYRMLRASRRYERLVSPDIRAIYQIAGRVLATPRVVVMNERGRFGLEIEPLAALIGDGAAFVDLEVFEGEVSRFAGEAAFLRASEPMPADDASPADVVEALIDAIKDGDVARWRALFAGWSIRYIGDRPVYSPWGAQVREGDWEDSRRRLLTDVLDAHAVWVGDPVAITEGGEFPGAPRIEQVDVLVAHVGEFGGERRTFRKLAVHPFWQLQRLDQGPWRISSCQSI